MAETATEEAGGASAPPTIRRFRLTVAEGPDQGAVLRSSDQRVVVGTHASATLILTDRTVSRFHFEVSLEHGQCFIRDLGSRNGTRVGTVAVLHAPLVQGARIGAGRSELVFDLGDERVPLAVSRRESFGRLVGKSIAMRAVVAQLERAAETDSTLLIEGETGTGKGLAADAVHSESARASGPFVVVDCSATAPQLVESELFGHERGAFTGAIARREGAFEQARGGTIFLDEIGEMDEELQPKLLRAIEERRIKPVGSNDWRPVDVRIVAATNRELRALVNSGRFRPDLYYRLAVLSVRLPPLRERTEDLPLLARAMLAQLGVEEAQQTSLLTGPLLVRLAAHEWPGNVRELRNHLERYVVLGETGDAPTALPAIDMSAPYRAARDAFERRYLSELLARHAGNVRAAAETAGLDRVSLYRLLWRHGLR